MGIDSGVQWSKECGEDPIINGAGAEEGSGHSQVNSASALMALCAAALADDETVAYCCIATAVAASAVAGFYGFEPETYKQACSCPDHREWHKAMAVEVAALDGLGAFEYVDRDKVPAGTKVISCKWVNKIKPEKETSKTGKKYRFVFMHNNYEEYEYVEIMRVIEE